MWGRMLTGDFPQGLRRIMGALPSPPRCKLCNAPFRGPDLLEDGRRGRWWPLERDPMFLESSEPGVFVAGDVRHGSIKRVASAVGEGAMAIALIHRFLSA